MRRLIYLARVIELTKQEPGFEQTLLNHVPLPGTGASATGSYMSASLAQLRAFKCICGVFSHLHVIFIAGSQCLSHSRHNSVYMNE